MKIYLKLKSYNKRIFNIINLLKLTHDENSPMGLIINSDSLELYNREYPKQKSIKVDFCSKKNYYRCLHFKKKTKFYLR